MAPAGPGDDAPTTPTAQGSTTRDSIGSIMHEFVDSFPIDVDSRQSISDLGKVLFTEGQKPSESASSATNANAAQYGENDAKMGSCMDRKKPFQMPKEIKGIPRQKQQDVQGITPTGRVALPQGSVRKLFTTQGKAVPMRWTPEEDDMLRKAVETHGERNWKSIAEIVPGRNHTQCLQRWTKVLAPGLIKGHWRPEEDDILRQLVAEGRKNWGQVAARIPGRTSKQCRERWYNHLDPSIVRGDYTPEEDQIIIDAQQRIGNRWSAIAAMLPGRTEDAVKIRWKSLCRTKSGRNRKAQLEKDEKQGYDIHGGMQNPNAVVPPPYRMNHQHPGMNYPRTMDDQMSLPPFQQHGSHMPHHTGMGPGSMPDYQQPDVYNSFHHHHHAPATPSYMGQPSTPSYNPASAFMQKMNSGYQAPPQQQMPEYNSYYNNYQRQTTTSAGYQPTPFAPPTQDNYQGIKPEPSNPAASFAQNLPIQHPSPGGRVQGPATTPFGSSNSPRPSLVSSFVQSLNSGDTTPRHSLAADFVQSLSGPPRGPPMNLAASFAQSQNPNPNQLKGPAVAPVNIAASFAQRAMQSNTPTSSESTQEENTDPNKRPRLPVNMEAARAAAARRMRQGDNASDFVANPAEAPSGEMPRISVSDINLSELGPIEEMWRVSSDMNRLSL